MPIIEFSHADVMRSKLLETAWYSWQVKAISGPVSNKEKTGVNYSATLVLIENPNEDLNGKELDTMFGFSKGKGWGLEFIAAAMQCPLDALEGKQIDTDQLLGVKLDGKIKVDVYEGRQNNKFDGFLPYKKAAGQPTPF